MRLEALEKRAKIAAACATGGWKEYRLARQAITRHHAVQRTFELMTLCRRVRRLRPRRIIEIGTYLGGTLFCWPRLAAADAMIISVDLAGGPFGRDDDAATRTFESYMLNGQRLICVRGDSRADRTLADVRGHLEGQAVDFLFIDGDHSYETARSDYERFGALVRPGGLIALHDIIEDRHVPGSQVHRLWRELEQTNRVEAILDPDSVPGSGMGIGVVRV
jgi:predicted O-methyltransferase YrrM